MKKVWAGLAMLMGARGIIYLALNRAQHGAPTHDPYATGQVIGGVMLVLLLLWGIRATLNG
jgi:hypothetical protein